MLESCWPSWLELFLPSTVVRFIVYSKDFSFIIMLNLCELLHLWMPCAPSHLYIIFFWTLTSSWSRDYFKEHFGLHIHGERGVRAYNGDMGAVPLKWRRLSVWMSEEAAKFPSISVFNSIMHSLRNATSFDTYGMYLSWLSLCVRGSVSTTMTIFWAGGGG